MCVGIIGVRVRSRVVLHQVLQRRRAVNVDLTTHSDGNLKSVQFALEYALLSAIALANKMADKGSTVLP